MRPAQTTGWLVDANAGEGQPPPSAAATSFELVEPDWSPAVTERQPFAGSEEP